MIRYGIWVTFLLAVQLSFVLGRNEFYEYYYNKYHHNSHSTKSTTFTSSIAEISTEQKTSSSVSGDDDSSKSVEHSSTVDFELAKHKNKTSHSYGHYNRNTGARFAGLIFGIIFLLLFIVMLIVFCCYKKGCRRENKGFVLSNNDPQENQLVSENSLLHQAILPDYTLPPQQHTPYYQSGPPMPPYYCPAPTMYQHSPVPQVPPQGLPATPPPPYEVPLYAALPPRN